MTRPLRLTIPWKHLASSNTRNQRRGGKAHGWDYRHAREAILRHAQNEVPASMRPVCDGECRVELYFHPPDRRRRDVSNLAKVLLDGVQTVAYDDDYQARSVLIVREDPDPDYPRCEVTVWPME